MERFIKDSTDIAVKPRECLSCIPEGTHGADSTLDNEWMRQTHEPQSPQRLSTRPTLIPSPKKGVSLGTRATEGYVWYVAWLLRQTQLEPIEGGQYTQTLPARERDR